MVHVGFSGQFGVCDWVLGVCNVVSSTKQQFVGCNTTHFLWRFHGIVKCCQEVAVTRTNFLVAHGKDPVVPLFFFV